MRFVARTSNGFARNFGSIGSCHRSTSRLNNARRKETDPAGTSDWGCLNHLLLRSAGNRNSSSNSSSSDQIRYPRLLSSSLGTLVFWIGGWTLLCLKKGVPGDPASQTVCVNLVETVGLFCASYWGTCIAACGLRLTYHLLGLDFLLDLLHYADDLEGPL